MIWLLSRVVVWPTKAAVTGGVLATRLTARTAAGSAKVGYRAGRLVGYRRLTVVLIGVGIGLLVAPVPGRQLRATIRRRLDVATGRGTAPPPADLFDPASSNGIGAGDDRDLVGGTSAGRVSRAGSNPAP